jgi:hypothetical protein
MIHLCKLFYIFLIDYWNLLERVKTATMLAYLTSYSTGVSVEDTPQVTEPDNVQDDVVTDSYSPASYSSGEDSMVDSPVSSSGLPASIHNDSDNEDASSLSDEDAMAIDLATWEGVDFKPVSFGGMTQADLPGPFTVIHRMVADEDYKVSKFVLLVNGMSPVPNNMSCVDNESWDAVTKVMYDTSDHDPKNHAPKTIMVIDAIRICTELGLKNPLKLFMNSFTNYVFPQSSEELAAYIEFAMKLCPKYTDHILEWVAKQPEMKLNVTVSTATRDKALSYAENNLFRWYTLANSFGENTSWADEHAPEFKISRSMALRVLRLCPKTKNSQVISALSKEYQTLHRIKAGDMKTGDEMYFAVDADNRVPVFGSPDKKCVLVLLSDDTKMWLVVKKRFISTKGVKFIKGKFVSLEEVNNGTNVRLVDIHSSKIRESTCMHEGDCSELSNLFGFSHDLDMIMDIIGCGSIEKSDK